MNKNSNFIRFRPEWFGAYGLDKEKNFLQAPECECGCGSKCNILLHDTKDIFEFATSMLECHECGHCAIFAHAFNGKMYSVIKTKTKTDNPISYFGTEDTDMEFFKEWDDELNFHCYGLIIEVKKGEWKIIED